MRKQRGTEWTKERSAQLRELLAQGLSFTQAADELGVTKSAVAGKVDRGQYGHRSERTPAVDPPPSNPVWFGTCSIPAAQAAVSGPVSLFDLEPHHCRWPISESPYTFCGEASRDGSPYCTHHFGMSRRG